MRLDKLDYQLEAIDKALAAIKPENVSANKNAYANPIISNTPFIDVKMETGTGKTYVYTRLMHGLRQKYGIFKFIILVPSVAIKEGVKMSIASGDWNKHFRQEFGNQSIHLGVVNAGDFDAKKGRRRQIPEALRSFCDASAVEDKSVRVLLLNDGMLSSSSMSKTDYDSTLFGNISCPMEGLKETRPIVIIDEPHRFNKANKAWKNINEGLCPQIIIRFGATFPEVKEGGVTKKDYENLVYDLNSIQAFNEGLVKSVHIEYPALPDEKSELLKYKVKQIKRGKSVTFAKTGSKKDSVLGIGEDIAVVDPQFSGGITLEEASSAQAALLSNGLELHPGMELIPQVFSSGYQGLILNQALEAHFEKEKRNFYRKSAGGDLPRIKTNSLFFIDNIASFRGKNEQGWLRAKFEELLRKKIEKELKEAKGEYEEFLQASLKHNERGEMAAIAGYFAEDNSQKGDAAIQDEVDKVLRDKEQSLQFKNKDGKWNVCRFFFSKWTLCEGWDNPNVFVIAKLRSSGSEIRKLQEVGRGLRLPFDETGSRLTPAQYGEDFRLTYIIDYSEKEFAKKLAGEINADGGKLEKGKITDDVLEILVKAGYAVNKDEAFVNLLNAGIINRHEEIKDTEALLGLLPEGSGYKIRNGVITGNGMPQAPKVRLNKDNFIKIKDLWDKVNRRYVLEFKELGKSSLEGILLDIFSREDLFIKPVLEIKDEYVKSDGKAAVVETGGYRFADSVIGVMHYGEFLKRLSKRTSLPAAMIHNAIAKARLGKNTPAELFNANTLEKIIDAFEAKFMETYNQKFTYQPLDYAAQTSLFKDGDFVAELNQHYLGMNIAKDDTIDIARYLYDKAAYDSDIEHEVLKVPLPPQVTVYGKLPRKSIRLPTYTGGTTSP
ncbi:MAG: type III restriction-modification system endonuclease, partial [Treponema sp.]|nr:type III restriction-modification system endonuclease [Treponema sp.]